MSTFYITFLHKVSKFRKCSSNEMIKTAARFESLNGDSARGYIIKDELVTISNRQTNWTTLGNTP